MSIQTLESYASQALSCTHQMHALAVEQNWDALTKLETERAVLLESLFNHPLLPSMLARIADSIRRIIEIDQQTIAMSKDAHQALRREMDLLKQGKRAVDAYLGNIV